MAWTQVLRRRCGLLPALLLVACSQPAPSSSEKPAAAPTAFVWPATLSPFGDGFPNAGDPCRRLGESPLTASYLDDSAILVGCPGAAFDAAAASVINGKAGRVVGAAEGVTLISIPQGDANQGMPAADEATAASKK
ncbi:hypothetical protein EUV02_10355 [Polymorphobacter arshaanensis]|uniref:Uncharacterized protein n=1 Tax=Glacieibacterium arshaanense TaxID=2511025 RepID=A0A4Y9EPJ9_9SPHN|nr:hypothetical protein [Polymorphobacter arshaanensis]TFU03554.1 hypothetical protein EUV02_10355 [Polymorphobacter arshaanensis]